MKNYILRVIRNDYLRDLLIMKPLAVGIIVMIFSIIALIPCYIVLKEEEKYI